MDRLKWYNVEWLTMKGVLKVKAYADVGPDKCYVEKVVIDGKTTYLDKFSSAERYSLYGELRKLEGFKT